VELQQWELLDKASGNIDDNRDSLEQFLTSIGDLPMKVKETN
jgi:hypothetical protein